MKLTTVLSVTTLLLSTFATLATAETIAGQKEHCQSDAELTFNGWNVKPVSVELVSKTEVRFILHSTDHTRALRQQTVTFGESTLCVQQEINKESR